MSRGLPIFIGIVLFLLLVVGGPMLFCGASFIEALSGLGKLLWGIGEGIVWFVTGCWNLGVQIWEMGLCLPCLGVLVILALVVIFRPKGS